jgi:hypothetical protein
LTLAGVLGCPQGEGAPSPEVAAVDSDGDGWVDTEDCEPLNPEVNPDATEVCDNGLDDDCDASANDCGWQGESSLFEVATLVGSETGFDSAGHALAGAGDVDGDGYDDFVVTSLSSFSGYNSDVYIPSAYVVRGGESDLPLTLADAWLTIRGPEGLYMGQTLAPLGDIDGDGQSEFAVDSVGEPSGMYPFGVYIFGGLGAGDWAMTDALGSITTAGPAYYFLLVGPSQSTDLGGGAGTDVLALAFEHVDGIAEHRTIYVCDAVARVGEDVDSCHASVSTGSDGAVGVTYAAAISNISGDGAATLAFTARPDDESDYSVYLFEGPLDGHFTLSDATSELYGDAVEYAQPVNAGDTDGDGYGELLLRISDVSQESGAADPAAGAALIRNPLVGGRALDRADAIVAYAGDPPTRAAIATCGGGADDVDGDRRDDLVIRGANSLLLFTEPLSGWVEPTSATATFLADAEGIESVGGRACVIAGDLDGDGHGEILANRDAHILPFDDGGVYVIYGEGL